MTKFGKHPDKDTVDLAAEAALGALATAHSTLEELALLQQLMRALGSGNVGQTTGGGLNLGGASGGDILFQEICAGRGIETRFYLAVQPQVYVTTSVNKAKGNWVQRFWDLHAAHVACNQVRILSQATDVKDDSEYLPAWLRDKKDYSIWQRNNLWMLFNALAEGCDDKTGDPNLTLIALWDGAEGDGPGGTGLQLRRGADAGGPEVHPGHGRRVGHPAQGR